MDDEVADSGLTGKFAVKIDGGVEGVVRCGDVVREDAAQLLALAEKQGGKVPLLRGQQAMASALGLTGNFAEGLLYSNQALALYDPVEHRPLACGGRRSALPRQHLVHPVRDDPATQPRPPAPGDISVEAAGTVSTPARSEADSSGDGSVHRPRQHCSGVRPARRGPA